MFYERIGLAFYQGEDQIRGFSMTVTQYYHFSSPACDPSRMIIKVQLTLKVRLSTNDGRMSYWLFNRYENNFECSRTFGACRHIY